MSFHPREPGYDISIAGFGQLGRAFVRILAAEEGRAGPAFKVVSLADSSGSITDPAGIAPRRLAGLAAAKEGGSSLAMLGARAGPAPASARSIHVELGPTDAASGGPALGRIIEALREGSAVVASCKGPFVAAWDEVMDAARASGAPLRFSATVGAGTPLLDLGRSLALGSEILGVRACLNVTSLIVLGLMEEGIGVDAAVRRAQELGIAEADPAADLDGIDAAVKLCIISRAVLGRRLRLEDVERESVSAATSERVAAALARGMRLRALASLDCRGGLRASVRLAELPAASPLAAPGPSIALVYETARSGDVSVVGSGVGPAESASAVYRDLMAITGA
jgi:homoserine dehydrogenase